MTAVVSQRDPWLPWSKQDRKFDLVHAWFLINKVPVTSVHETFNTRGMTTTRQPRTGPPSQLATIGMSAQGSADCRTALDTCGASVSEIPTLSSGPRRRSRQSKGSLDDHAVIGTNDDATMSKLSAVCK